MHRGLVVLLSFAFAATATADTITVQVDITNGGTTHQDATGGATLGDPNFSSNDYPWSSRGWKGGSIIKNKSGKKIEDLHMHLDPPDKIDPKSSCGGAFSKTTVSADGSEMTCEGAPGIADGSDFWMQVPLSQPFDKGVGAWKGNLTPKPAAETAPPSTSGGSGGGCASRPAARGGVIAAPSPAKPPQQPTDFLASCTVHYVSATRSIGISCDATGNIQLALSPFGLKPWEPVAGAFTLTPANMTLTSGSVITSTAVGGVVFYPDRTQAGFDSAIQGNLLFVDASRQEAPPYLGPDHQSMVVISSSLLADSENFKHDADSKASLRISQSAR